MNINNKYYFKQTNYLKLNNYLKKIKFLHFLKWYLKYPKYLQ